jgi:hypothetical protein
VQVRFLSWAQTKRKRSTVSLKFYGAFFIHPPHYKIKKINKAAFTFARGSVRDNNLFIVKNFSMQIGSVLTITIPVSSSKSRKPDELDECQHRFFSIKNSFEFLSLPLLLPCLIQFLFIFAWKME